MDYDPSDWRQWSVRPPQDRDQFDPFEIYSQDTTLFTIKIFHRGQFLKSPTRSYVNGKIDYIDMVDIDEFSFYEFGQMFKSLGYPDEDIVFFYFKIPGRDLNSGLRLFENDEDLRFITPYVEHAKEFEIYVEHSNPRFSDLNQEVVDDNGPDYDHGHEQVENMSHVGFEHVHSTSEEDDESNSQSDESDSDFIADEDNIVEDVEVDMAEYKSIVEVEDNQHNESETDEHMEVDLDGFHTLSDDDTPLKSALMNLNVESKRQPQNSNGVVYPFYVGQIIGQKEEIKHLLKSYAVLTRRQLHVVRNDKKRFRVVCIGNNPESLSGGDHVRESNVAGGSSSKKSTKKQSNFTYPWTLNCSRKDEKDVFVVKTLIDQHLCLQTRDVNLYTISHIAKEIEPILEGNPTIPLKALQDQMQKKHQIHISVNQICRAKMKATLKLQGDYHEQYSMLRDYGEELIRSNPGTTVKIEVEPECNPSSPTRQFNRIYICLGALKEGFRSCGREILGLDGCFMKGPFPGQILTVVGLDANNGIYLVAYALVEAETTTSWTWFLEWLGEDLKLDQNSTFTFITDRQKGLIPALATVFPCSEHRFCLRHIHENMKLKWRGNLFRDLLWKCATATTIPQFNKAMEAVRKQDASLHAWLLQIPAKSWARSHFTGRAKSDILLNNLCEVFNKQLIGARDKLIITCLEFIREYLMKRIVLVHNKIAKNEGLLTPAITKIFNAIKNEASQYTVVLGGREKYQVSGPWSDQCTVDMKEKSCSCRKWELTGIPCKHVVVVLWDMSCVPETWVCEVYRVSKWREVYMNTIDPMNGVHLWQPSTCPTKLISPKHHKQIGRPKKKRKKSQEELLSTSFLMKEN